MNNGIDWTKARVLKIADLFCGAGGGTDATREAVELAGRQADFTLINHWDVACATAKANFPTARVLCTPVDSVIAQHLYLRDRLDVLQGGPECIEFSRAAGKKPTNYQYRPTPWCMVRFTEALRPKIVLIENVAEFAKKWPPFQAFVDAFKALGYEGDWRVFNAANYGDATTRERLFMLFVRRPLRVVWALPTHHEHGAGGLEVWRDAEKHVIDWTKKGRWLDEMPGKKCYGGLPLSPKSFIRIYDGLKRSGCQPLVVPFDNQSSKGRARTTKQPLSTITSKARHALAQPFLIHSAHGGARPARTVRKPLPTVAGNRGDLALVEPFLLPKLGRFSNNRPLSVKRPLNTVIGDGRVHLVQPMLLPQHGGGVMRSVKRPVPTIATDGVIHLIEPFIVKYYGTAKTVSIKRPLPTVTTKDRFALCCPEVLRDGKIERLRIRWRILEPHELAAAQGFRQGFRFFGGVRRRGKVIAIRENAHKGDIVKQIGNAWPHNLARALMLAALTQRADIRPFLKVKERAA